MPRSVAVTGGRPATASSSAEAGGRLWEIDVLRTAAIAMMVAYHAGYDVNALAPHVGLDPFGGGWRALQVATGSTFLVLVGVSAAISDARARGVGARGSALFRRPARRAVQVLAAAAAVSLATYLALGDEFVRFGILHLIGVSMLLAPAFTRLRRWNLALGMALIALGFVIRDMNADLPGSLVLGFRPAGEGGVDLYPLLPWFGLVLVGLALGDCLYPGGRRGPWTARLPDRAPPRTARLRSIGRHSLPIYLLHQPVLIPLVALALLIAGVELTSGI